MTLSIIIPVYNVEAYLTECLDSVYNQLAEGCEVIVVNDGSTDNSRQLLTDYQETHPDMIIIDQANRGLSGARNTGMAHAKGEYLYFLDSDDYMLPNAIQKILEAIANTQADVIGFNATANATAVYIPAFKVGEVPKSGIDYFVGFYRDNGAYPNINVPINVYRKSFLQGCQLTFKEGVYHEDVLFSLHVFYYAKSVCAVNFPIFNYRQHREGSICTNVKLKNLTDKSSICRELDEFYVSSGFDNVYFYNAIFYIYLYTISQGISSGYGTQLKQFYGKVDKAIAKKGITNEFEYKLWLLSTINTSLMLAYYRGKLPNWMRRLINRCLHSIC